MDQSVVPEIVRVPTQDEVATWHEKHGVKPDTDGWIDGMPDGKSPLPKEQLMANVAANALRNDISNMEPCLYRSATMVFVGGGPSAADFLDEIREKSKDFHYDVYCSNKTASWLLENGITPKYQVIIDAKPSKAADVAHKNPDITYLLGLQCDPVVFEMVKGLKVFKFLASSASVDGVKDTTVARAACTPENPNLIAIGGGTMMGTRALALANPLGYRRLEYYGFDGSVKLEGNRLQCYAYTKHRGEGVIEIEAEDGRVFNSTKVFAKQADEINLFRKMLPWIEIVIHGDGFIKHMMELDIAKEEKPASYRCSEHYRELQLQMAPEYEGVGRLYAGRVYLIASQLIKRYGPITLLDYGCGPQALEKTIMSDYATLVYDEDYRYHPALSFRNYDVIDSVDPLPADLVACTDVMEHVEPECVPAVLDHIQALTKRTAFFAIDTQPAKKLLPDGRNAHICLKPPEYWDGQLKKRFIVVESYSRGSTIMFVCQSFPKERP